MSPIRKLLLSTQCEDETQSDRQHRTISKWKMCFLASWNESATRTDGFLLFSKNGVLTSSFPGLGKPASFEIQTSQANVLPGCPPAHTSLSQVTVPKRHPRVRSWQVGSLIRANLEKCKDNDEGLKEPPTRFGPMKGWCLHVVPPCPRGR